MKNAKEVALDCFKEWFPFIAHTHGFNADGLKALISNASGYICGERPLRILEVGSWMGGSARFFASRPEVASVVCVDHWDRNKVENWRPGIHPEEWMNFMYEHFLANCLHSGLAEKIYPLRMDSRTGAKALWGQSFDLVYLDGAHQTKAVYQDLVEYFPMAHILCGDDWVFDKEPENVRGAVQAFASERGLTVHNDGNLWWLES